MRRAIRIVGTLSVVVGIGLLAWSFTVWRWQDPVTAIYTELEQRNLSRGYDEFAAGYAATPASETAEPEPEPRTLPEAAAEYREALDRGDPVGRLHIPRLGLTTMIVEGTDDDTLRSGPGRYRDLAVPGQGELVYVAGHRTTYSAPFARIDELRPGDAVIVDVPYGRFEYRITGHTIVRETDVSVLESQGEEQLALQACHPRFFASHRYIAYAEPVSVETRAPVVEQEALARP